MANRSDGVDALGTALRVAVASVSCLLLCEWFDIRQTALSVYTTFLVMALFPITSFQKGAERLVGRTMGLVYGYAVIWLARDTVLLYLALIALGQVVACYIYLSGRLAYAALMAAIFVGVIAAIGATVPRTAGDYVVSAVWQLAIGELAAFLVNYFTIAENTLAIEVGGQPLFPLRWDWQNTAIMLCAGQIAAMFLTIEFDLPVTATMVSAMVIGVVPGGLVEEGQKAWQRLLGAVLGGGYALLSMILLAYQPNLWLMALLVTFIMFLATYLTKTSIKNSYAFLQMGMVAPMVLIAENGAIGSIETALKRMMGIGLGLVAAGVVSILWPHTPIAATAAPVAPVPKAQVPARP